jgi:hypothetical protein
VNDDEADEQPIVVIDVAQGTVEVDCPCVQCGYNLRSLPLDGRCPECGRLAAPSYSRTSLVILVFLAYVSLGLPDAINGVAWPAVRQTFDQPISALWALLMTSTVGYLMASFTSAAVVARIGVGWVLCGSSALIVLGMVGYALAPTWPTMAACGLLAGLGGGSTRR